MLIPTDVIILMITTNLNFGLATDKNNKRRWINILCTMLGLVVIGYKFLYNGL